ncbi:hypothetical protein [Rubrivivax gelatinosus]|uniref:hypothetical protein n=1 Tax=Rubrivivax gelatinosus TaxID=28068 RepID=UPI0012FDAF40|nr:hypothetical protein [Rubrivivax gelatinosus]MBG6083018.1 hypothetical protein [Rubrivivax gelatinosus]
MNVAEAVIAKQRMDPTGRISLISQKQYSRLRNCSGAPPESEPKANGGHGAGGGAFSVSKPL